MITVTGWLPIGSVVHLREEDMLVFVAGAMQQDADEGTLWDYFGYPYPAGNTGTEAGVLFNRDSYDSVLYLGYQDADGLRFEEMLESQQERFDEARAAASGEDAR